MSFELIKSEPLFQGRAFKIRRDTMKTPDGRETKFDIVEHGGSVIATSIDKYCHLACRYLPPFFEHRIRVVWSMIENCTELEQVSHPAVRAVVKRLGLDRCLENR